MTKWTQDRSPGTGGSGVKVRGSLKPVEVIILDVRRGPIKTVLRGDLPIPNAMMQERIKVNWKVDGIYARTEKGLIKNCPGTVTDVTASDGFTPKITFVFPFIQECDAVRADGYPLSHEDIVGLFLKWEPSLRREDV